MSDELVERCIQATAVYSAMFNSKTNHLILLGWQPMNFFPADLH